MWRPGSGEIAEPTPPTTSGIASGRKSSGRISSRGRLGGAPGAGRGPPGPRAGVAGGPGGGLAGPDRAAVARREDEPVEDAALALGRPAPREPEERGEDERDPEEPLRGGLARAPRQRAAEEDAGGE